MRRDKYDALALNSLHDLTFALSRTHETYGKPLPSGYTGSVTLQNLLILSSQSLTPGLRDDPAETLLVELADYRHVLGMIPCDVAYNVSSTPDNTYYSSTINGGVTPYTWSEIVSALWSLVGTATLGTYPGLPFTPDGTPRDFRFYGGKALAALGEVLTRIGCDLQYNPIANTYGIVQVGATDATHTAWLATWDAYRVHDAYPEVSNVGRYPAAVRVLFRKLPPPAGASPWYTITESPPVAYSESGSTASTVVDLHDDLPAVYNAGGTLQNGSDLAARATERASDFYRRLTSTWEPQRRRYALPSSAAGCLPGKQVDSTWWGDIGAVSPDSRAGLHTEVASHPPEKILRGVNSGLAEYDRLYPENHNQTLDTYSVSLYDLTVTNSFTGPSSGTTTVYNLTVNGTSTFNGPTLYPPYGAAVTINANTDNLALAAGPVQFWNVTSAVNITGVVAGSSGYRVVFVNTGNATLTLKNEDASSTAANRFRTPYATKADVLLPPNFACELQYDTSISRWRILWVSSVHLIGTDDSVGALGATETDYAMDQRYPFQVWTVAAGGTRLNSIANGKLGQFYWIAVADGNPEDKLTIGHQDSGGAAGNLINCPGEIDYVVPSCGGVILFYDGTFWQVVAAIPSRPKVTTITDANIVLPVPIGPQEFAMLGVPLTAVRTVTLPSASTAKAGTVVTIVDKAGSLGTTNYLSVIRAGSDTINGATSYSMQTPYMIQDFVSDGSSAWTVNPASGGSGVALTATRIGYGNASNVLTGTADLTRTADGVVNQVAQGATAVGALLVGTANNGVNQSDGDTMGSVTLSGRHTGSVQGGVQLRGMVQSAASATATVAEIGVGVTDVATVAMRFRSDGKAQFGQAATASRILVTDANGNVATDTAAGQGLAVTSGTLAQFAATTSAQLASVLSDETGSGALVFGTSPTLVTPALGTPSAINLSNATNTPFPKGYIYGLALKWLTGGTIQVGAGKARNSADAADITLSSAVTVDGTTTGALGFANKTLSGTGAYTNTGTTLTGTSTTFLTQFGTRTCTGTITGAGTTITGTGTKFLSEFSVNDLIGTNVKGYSRITAIASDTSLTIVAAIPGGSPAGTTPVCIENASITAGTQAPRQVATIVSDTSLTVSVAWTATASGQTCYTGECPLGTVTTDLFIWLLSGGSGTTATFSTQRTTPFDLTGYTTSVRRVGSFTYDATTALIVPFTAERSGSTIRYIFSAAANTYGNRIVSSASAAAWTRVSCRPLVPATATEVMLGAFLVNPAGNVSVNLRGSSLDGYAGLTSPHRVNAEIGGRSGAQLHLGCDGAQCIDWTLNVADANNPVTIEIGGYSEVLS